MAKKSNLTTSQRREVVLTLIRRDEPAAQLARRWGVSEPTLYRWRDEFLAGGEAALANGKGGSDARDREIRDLKSQLEERDQDCTKHAPEDTQSPQGVGQRTPWSARSIPGR